MSREDTGRLAIFPVLPNRFKTGKSNMKRLLKYLALCFVGLIALTIISFYILLSKSLPDLPKLNQPTSSLAISNVTVINPIDSTIVSHQTVLIENGRIISVDDTGSNTLAESVTNIDGNGKFLIPGFWDMHSHLRHQYEPYLSMPLFIANGVFNIRDMGTDVSNQQNNQWRRQILAGELMGPRVMGQVSAIISRLRSKADADAIIASGLYSLEGNYASNFAVENSGSNENIFVVPYDKVFAGGFNWVAMTLHYASQNTFNLTFQPWNGYATVEEFYNSYVDPVSNPGPQGTVFKGKGTATGTLDSRLSNFVVGPQGTDDPAGGEAGDDDGVGLNFTPYINSIWPDACRQCGARIGKYAYENGQTPNMSNDWVLFRYGDILLGKAEAHLRTGDAAGALGIVNQIRARAGVDAYTSLDLDNLLAERGREMYVENDRRQSLIRFGKFNDAWWEKGVSGSHMTIFPIPKPQLDANSKLTQNPGY